MRFVKKSENTAPYIDNIFSVVKAAKADDLALNATAGCLYDEEGKLFTFDCVYDNEKKISPAQKAAYAQAVEGNKAYNDAVERFILDGRVDNHHGIVASAGGTGAIYMAIRTCLDPGDTIIYPITAWGNYKVFADENGLNVVNYDVYDMDDLLEKIDSVEGKVFLIVNSPCQNPLGHAYSLEEWKRIVEKLSSLKREAILLCDIAYIDYAHGDTRQFMELFNDIGDDLLVLIAASCSKAFSYYGQRLGALIAINNDEGFIEHYINLCSRLARTTWSNLNNAAMINIAQVLDERFDEYKAELEKAREMLKRRVGLFIRQADECGLELYRPEDGFFVTVKLADNKLRDDLHQNLIDAHIYTIKVNKGIRVALCSLPLNKVDGLAEKIKELM